MSCIKKRRESPIQQVIRLLHKTHKEVHAILAIVSDSPPTDDKGIKGNIVRLRRSQHNLQSALDNAGAETTKQKGK